ncbi:hypothetical protein E2C01_075296 [Portunus trituberculatus]|uniref:Uncharacterized protein n=1 Tax=Portunus trituberculatus TaxID=210409 RepID=A0A5B7IIS3_PORTR|nr:hypothetical protein [Portunus trituberculatus]
MGRRPRHMAMIRFGKFAPAGHHYVRRAAGAASKEPQRCANNEGGQWASIWLKLCRGKHQLAGR